MCFVSYRIRCTRSGMESRRQSSVRTCSTLHQRGFVLRGGYMARRPRRQTGERVLRRRLFGATRVAPSELCRHSRESNVAWQTVREGVGRRSNGSLRETRCIPSGAYRRHGGRDASWMHRRCCRNLILHLVNYLRLHYDIQAILSLAKVARTNQLILR